MVCLWAFNLNAQQTRDQVLENTDRVTQMYAMDKEILPYDEVVGLATEIVQHRQLYNKEVIAKSYVLLAEVAENKGDAARSFQFAVDGLTYKPLPAEIQLNLEIKLASGYFAKGMYRNVFHFVEQALKLAKDKEIIKYQLLALGYRAMANALVGNEKKASADLVSIKLLIDTHQQYAEHLELLDIIAISYHYLGDYKTAMEMHERILKLRFALNKMNGIEETYYNLAGAYLQFGKYDDAYNAFWEVKQIAETNNWPIKRAYAELGIGKVFLGQEDYKQAYPALVEAENSFKGQNLNKPYLSALTALAKVSLATNRKEFGYELLSIAEELMQIAELTSEQIELYALLAKKYEEQGQPELALARLNQYVKLQHQFYKDTKMHIIHTPEAPKFKESNKNIALNLARSYEEHTEYSEKLAIQKKYLSILAITVILLLVVLIVQWLSYRSKKQNYVYEQIERPVYIVANPAQTKYIYHRAFKKARKYEYPLSVGYLTIANWQDLTFSFNKKVINEVNRTIATLINEHLGEFDQSGQISEGEYILLYPHQTIEEANVLFEKLLEALKVRFFANLGEFSVNIRYSVGSPNVQDIDPYIFLSRLSDIS